MDAYCSVKRIAYSNSNVFVPNFGKALEVKQSHQYPSKISQIRSEFEMGISSIRANENYERQSCIQENRQPYI